MIPFSCPLPHLVAVHHPDFPDRLIEGRLYPSRYLGSTQLLCDDHPSKINRLRQAQEAVNRIKVGLSISYTRRSLVCPTAYIDISR